MINLISKKALSVISTAIIATGLSTSTLAQDTVTAEPAVVSSGPCISPTEPIIPDGNIATKEELVGASKAIKALQSELEVYRNCIAGKSNSITGEDEASTQQKQVYVDQYNASVDLEEKVAADFNTAIGAFKSR